MDYTRIHFHLTEEDSNMLELIDKKKSVGVRVGIRSVYENPFVVMKVANAVNNRELYCVVKTVEYFTDGFKPKFLSTCSVLELDLLEYGHSAFSFSCVGMFKSQLDAVEFKDFWLNRSVDAGVVLYNSELYSGAAVRVLSIPLNIGISNDLHEICVAQGKKVQVMVSAFIKKYVRTFSNLLSK